MSLVADMHPGVGNPRIIALNRGLAALWKRQVSPSPLSRNLCATDSPWFVHIDRSGIIYGCEAESAAEPEPLS